MSDLMPLINQRGSTYMQETRLVNVKYVAVNSCDIYLCPRNPWVMATKCLHTLKSGTIKVVTVHRRAYSVPCCGGDHISSCCMNGVMFRTIQVWRHQLSLEQAFTACPVLRARFGLHAGNMKFSTPKLVWVTCNKDLLITLGRINKEMQFTPSTRTSLFFSTVFENWIANVF